MILIAGLLLAFFPPGLLFPQMAANKSARSKSRVETNKGGDTMPATPATGEESQDPDTPERVPEKQV